MTSIYNSVYLHFYKAYNNQTGWDGSMHFAFMYDEVTTSLSRDKG